LTKGLYESPMPTQPIYKEPQDVTAGDTVTWYRVVSDYPASEGWTLYYVFRGPTTIKLTAATYQTSNYVVTVADTVTADWKPGLYSVAAYVSDGSDRYSVATWFPQITILPNPEKYVEGSADNLTFAQKTLAAVETALLALASRKVASASVNGQSYSIQDVAKLTALRNRMREEVQSEKDAILYAAGLGGKKNILVRFPPLNNQAAWYQEGVPPVN
jgi:hypothetical protein